MAFLCYIIILISKSEPVVEIDDDEMLKNLKLNIQQKYNENPDRVMKIIKQK